MAEPSIPRGPSNIPKIASPLEELSAQDVPFVSIQDEPDLPSQEVEAPVSGLLEKASPVFFTLSVPVPEVSPLTIPELPPPLPVGGSPVRASDPEFDSLPDAPSLGAKLAIWSIILSVLGLLICFFPFLGILIGGPLFLLALVLAIISFFKVPIKGRSILALALSLLFPVFGVAATLFLPFLALKGQLVGIVKEADDQKTKLLAEASSGNGTGSAVPALDAVPPVNLEDPEVDVSEEVATTILPPEQRPRSVLPMPELEVVPPEQRSLKFSVSNVRLTALWKALELGLDLNATQEQRDISQRISELVGTPLVVLVGLDSAQRLYVIRQWLLQEGVDLGTLGDKEPQEIFVP